MEYWKGNEYDALKLRFENQTEQLHRMTLIDLRIISGFLGMQLALGAWFATNGAKLSGAWPRVGVFAIDLALAIIAFFLLRNNQLRRNEVKDTVVNCARALGYKEPGVYLQGAPLDAKFEFRPWGPWYFFGIAVSVIGIALVLARAS